MGGDLTDIIVGMLGATGIGCPYNKVVDFRLV